MEKKENKASKPGFNRRAFLARMARLVGAAPHIDRISPRTLSRIGAADAAIDPEMRNILNQSRDLAPEEEFRLSILSGQVNIDRLIGLVNAIKNVNPSDPSSVARLSNGFGAYLSTVEVPNYHECKRKFDEAIADPEQASIAARAFPEGFPSLRIFLSDIAASFIEEKTLAPETRGLLNAIAEQIIHKLAGAAALHPSVKEKTPDTRLEMPKLQPRRLIPGEAGCCPDWL